MEKVLVIVGPTAVGKTALSVELAKKFNGEIISGDSLQIYKKLDIGTAKISTSEMSGIPHHLIDVIEPTDNYSVADFQKAGRQLITEITERGHLPIIAGGTGLYIQSLLYDYQLGAKEEVVSDVRKKYEELAGKIGKKQLWEYLKEKDPLAAEKIHWNNQRKVIRALEVFEVTGYSIMTPKEKPQCLYEYCMIGLDTDRKLLYQRIDQRVDQMIAAGLVDEARFVYSLGEIQASQGIGYKELYPYFKGEITLEEAVEQIKQNSRRYAKRQLTWFRNRL
ncbi:tRNA (adenosine(37)-N6)-dimethylallyltransferase MiaA, partial [Enterococcus durans]